MAKFSLIVIKGEETSIYSSCLGGGATFPNEQEF